MILSVSAQEVYRWIVANVGVDSPLASIERLVQSAIEELCPGANELDVLEKRDSVLSAVRSTLINEQTRAMSTGIPAFEIVGQMKDGIKGMALGLPTDSPELAERRRRHAFTRQAEQAIRDITPAEFELLCGAVLANLGGTRVTVTRASGDGGVDFKGVFPLFHLLDRFDRATPEWLHGLGRQSLVHAVGQAKQWPDTPVQPAHLRELLGACALYLLDVNPRAIASVLGIFITSGRFTAGAEETGRKAGIVTLDGEWLASSIVYSGFGITTVDGEEEFREDKFRQSLLAVEKE